MKNVHIKRDGRAYFRRKVKGRDYYIRLEHGPDHPLFSVELERIRSGFSGTRPKAAEGTLAALVADFKASSSFTALPSSVTRANYQRYLDIIARDDGYRTVKGLKPSYVAKLRDRYKDTPGKANNWLSIFKTLMDYAAFNDWRDDNPAARLRPLPIGEHEPWPATVLERALSAASPMTRLAIVLGVTTGCRIGDAVRIQHRWLEGGVLEYTASKNKTDVAIPIHPLLTAEIAKLERKAVTVLYDRSGKPFSSRKTLSERIRDLMATIGEADYSFHGLRKNAACYLAEMGMSDTDIGSMLAMTSETVRHYTKRKRAYMVARRTADAVRRGDVLQLKGGRGK
jgi:integrase